MVDYDTQIKELEDELRKTAYNKRTQHHIGLVKAKIARLRERQTVRASSKGKSEGYAVRKSGDATVALVGFPSVGKSTLLNQLTNAESKTAGYAFTTLTCIPGIMTYNHARIQILDLPGIVKGAAAGTGRGREVLAVLRTADMVLMVLDVFELPHRDALLKELHDAGLRVNQRLPDVSIRKTERGGVQIASTIKLKQLYPETIRGILHEFKLSNAYVLLREDITAEQLIDVIEGKKHYLPMVTVVNKVDLATSARLETVRTSVPDAVFVSAEKGEGIEALKHTLFDRLNLMRIYLREVGKKADMNEPLIIRRGATIQDVCIKLHRDFVDKFRFARVWGPSAKFAGQKFMLSHTLTDGDVLQIFLK